MATKHNGVQNGSADGVGTSQQEPAGPTEAAGPAGVAGVAGPDNSVSVTALYAVTIINQTCMFIYLGMMPFLFKQYGMDPITFGYFMSFFSFTTLLSSPVLGRIADVFGSRWVLIFSNASSAAAHFTMSIAGGVPMLLMSRLVSLLMDMLPGAQMAITDLVSEKDRGRYLGKIMIPMSVGMIVGPTLGGTLSQYLGMQGALMLTCIAPLINIFIVLTFIPAKQKQATAPAPAAKKGGINWSRLSEFVGKGDIPFLLIIRVLSTLPGMIFMMNFQLAGINYFKMTPQGNGMVVSTLGVFNMLNNWYVLGYLGKRFTPDQLMKWTPVLSVLTYFLMSQTTEVWQLIVTLYLVNLCYAIMENQVMTRLTRSVDAKDTSTMVGIGTALFHFSRTLSPTLGGILMAKMGWPAIGHIGFVVSIFMASLSMVKYR